MCTKSVCLVCCSCSPSVRCQSQEADRLEVGGMIGRSHSHFKRRVYLHRPAEDCFSWNGPKLFEWLWLAAVATCTSNAQCCCPAKFVLLASFVSHVFCFLRQVNQILDSLLSRGHTYSSSTTSILNNSM